MCRSIKVLRTPEQTATPDEIRAAALQFVRKISGFQKPSKANQLAFERAIQEIAASSDRLLRAIQARPVSAFSAPAETKLDTEESNVHQR